MSSRGRAVVPALACALVALSFAPAGTAAAPAAASQTTTRRAAPTTVGVPAYVGRSTLRARLPSGGLVSYRLPTLHPGGHRVLGDWDGDGVETTGRFVAGQWELTNSVVRPGARTTDVSFGQAGDRPVVGDWNGDGVTDLGVVRGTDWLLALGPFTSGGAPDVWRNVTFGLARGAPLAGDWDGDGTDGLASFRGRRWVLASSADAVDAARAFSYGRPGDEPVAGDWNGDGTDGIGVVRGSTWYLSQSAFRPHTVSRPVLPRHAGDVPEAWDVATSTGGATCPTRGPATIAANRSWVVPSPVLGRDFVGTVDRTGRLVRGSLMQSERYLLGTRYDERWRATRSRAYLGLLGGTSDELSIRLPAMSALTVAVGLRAGAYDERRIGRSTSAAESYVDQLVRSVACTHEAVSPGGWGLGWQTAHWAMLAGAAAWLVWDELTRTTQADVTRMVVAEADHQTTLAVPYWSSPDGTRLTPGDTKAEEDAWNAGLLSLAASMMPSAPHAALWRAKAAELGVAAYSTQDDVTSTTPVNGVPLSARLQGFNAYPDGTVENHARIHPDYASAVQLLWLSADFARLARQRVPEAMFHNGGLVYSALSTIHYTPGDPSPAGGTYVAPGGTVYRPGSSRIYYPQGDDWGTARRAHFVSLDAHAMVYAPYVAATGWPASDALLAHERGQRALVAASGAPDGRTYSVDPAVAATQDTYPGREEYAAENLATAWLALYVGQLGLPRLDTGFLDVPAATSRAPQAPAVSARVGP